MTTICSLKANVTREAAIRQFSDGVPGLWNAIWRGKLRSIADVYVPFWIFQVDISNGGHTESRVLGIDAVTATFDLYSFDVLPAGNDVVQVETRNRPQHLVDEQEARARVVEKVRRMVFRTGFFRVRDLQITAHLVQTDLHVPYWVGFWGNGGAATLAVIDAVRRRPEGAKVRDFFRQWLADPALQSMDQES